MQTIAPNTHITVPVTASEENLSLSSFPYAIADVKEGATAVRIGRNRNAVVEVVDFPHGTRGNFDVVAMYPLSALEAVTVVDDAPRIVQLFATMGRDDRPATIMLPNGREVEFQSEALHIQFGGSSLLLAPVDVEGVATARLLMRAFSRATDGVLGMADAGEWFC